MSRGLSRRDPSPIRSAYAGSVIQFVGYVGSAGAALMWLPQARRALRGRKNPAALAGISPASYLLAAVFNTLLATYGSLEHAVPVVVAGCVNLCCAVTILASVSTTRRPTR